MSVDLRARLLLGERRGAEVPAPDWLADTHARLCQSLLHRAYPCYLGTAAEKQGELLVTYLEGEERTHLPLTLSSFLRLSAAHPQQRYVLALFYPPEATARSLADYSRQFWELLQFLHDHDPAPWPLEQPQDPQDPQWEFVYDGTPMFVFQACPGYQRRRSRHLGPGLIVLFQPRRVFADILGGTPAGIKTRKLIRQRQAAWDQMEAHPDMGSYGDPANHEWKQYVLPDDNTPVSGRCPLHLHRQLDIEQTSRDLRRDSHASLG